MGAHPSVPIHHGRHSPPPPSGAPAQVQPCRVAPWQMLPLLLLEARTRKSARDSMTEVTLSKLLPFRWPGLALSLLDGPQPSVRSTCHISPSQLPSLRGRGPHLSMISTPQKPEPPGRSSDAQSQPGSPSLPLTHLKRPRGPHTDSGQASLSLEGPKHTEWMGGLQESWPDSLSQTPPPALERREEVSTDHPVGAGGPHHVAAVLPVHLPRGGLEFKMENRETADLQRAVALSGECRF